jgi:hypothetical protein
MRRRCGFVVGGGLVINRAPAPPCGGLGWNCGGGGLLALAFVFVAC